MNPKQVRWGVIVVMACLFAQPARATPHETKFLKIIDIGCHQVNDHCYLTLSEAVPVDIDCTYSRGMTAQFRWDDPDQPKGKRTFAALYGAFLAGRSVSLQVAGCSGSGYATFGYYHIQ